MITTLQHIVLPPKDGSVDTRLYAQPNDLARLDLQQGRIDLAPGGKVDFTTYFNAFSLTRWRQYTTLESLTLVLRIRGEAQLSVITQAPGCSRRIVSQRNVSNASGEDQLVPLGDLSELGQGMLSVELHSLSECEFLSGEFITTQVSPNHVSLGIVITNYQRDENVIRVAREIHKELISAPGKRENLALCIVDNSQSLHEDEVPGNCHLIPSKNFGGAGGFARGLLHFSEQEPGVTHCLFMDDDAGCEIESIRRTIRLLEYARTPELAVAGAMLLDHLTHIQHESGARFDGACRPLKQGLDLSCKDQILANDVIEKIGYGGWWFFAFPLASTKRYPFPYFVRGDDVLFSMSNRFEIGALNGICSWHESFALRSTPLTVYLDMRSHFAHHLLTDKLKLSAWKILSVFWYFFLKNNAGYRYASAEAICVALEDVLKPSRFWLENLDMVEVRETLKPLVDAEQDLSLQDFTEMAPELGPELRTMRWLRLGLLNGHLLPKFLMRRETAIDKAHAPFLRHVFLYRRATILAPHSQRGRVFEHSKPYFFKNCLRALRLSLKLIAARGGLEQKGADMRENMTADFWRHAHRLNDRMQPVQPTCQKRDA